MHRSNGNRGLGQSAARDPRCLGRGGTTHGSTGRGSRGHLSDPDEHRRRAEMRISDIPGLQLPTWEEIVSREYHPWDREHIVVDTALRDVEQNVKMLREALAAQRG